MLESLRVIVLNLLDLKMLKAWINNSFIIFFINRNSKKSYQTIVQSFLPVDYVKYERFKNDATD